MTDKFKLDDVVGRVFESMIPLDAQGTVLGPSFDYYGETLYPVKWFGHPNMDKGKYPCSLPDCATRDHWHSREAAMRKLS